MSKAEHPERSLRLLLLTGLAASWIGVGGGVALAQGLDMDANPNTPLPSAPAQKPSASVQDGIAPLAPRLTPGQAAGSSGAPGQPAVGQAGVEQPAAQAPQTGQTATVQPGASGGPGTEAPAAIPASAPSTGEPATTAPSADGSGSPAPWTPAGSDQGTNSPATNVSGVPSGSGAPGVAAPPAAGISPAGIAPDQAAAEPVRLDHPTVVDTAQLKSGDMTVSLFGIDGLGGEAAQSLQSYLDSTDQHLTCQPQATVGFVCLESDGTDLALVALVNGAAETKPEAPDPYQQQELAAQTARRGIWANLPPPPETLTHPTVPDTATLTVSDRTYPLEGIIGFGQPYASQLQGYIAAAGDSVTCAEQQDSGAYICVLSDGTDVAKVALVNGAARVAADAPDAYRVQQLDALNHHRGYWLNPPPDAVAMTETAAPVEEQYAFVAGDDGADGVAYVGGAPTAVIDGEDVFLVLGAGALGWGYYDHYHHWHGAPDRYRRHLDHFHPGGRGLRGYRTDAAFRHDGGIRREGAFHGAEAMRHDAAMRPGGMEAHGGFNRPGFENHGGFTRPGGMEAHGGFNRPGGMGMERPGMAAGRPGGMGVERPGGMGMARPGGMEPGGRPANMAMARPGGMAPGGFRPAGMAGGMRPGGMPGGLGGGMRPGGMGGGFHPAAAAPHISAPAPHVAAAGGKHR